MIPPNTFFYNGQPIRVVVHQNATWLVLNDICQAFHLGDAAMVASTLADHEQQSLSLDLRCSRQQKLILLNGLGLTHLLGRLYHPEVEPFQNWVRTVVIPSMQKGGDLPGQDSIGTGNLPFAEDQPAQNIFENRDMERQLQDLLGQNARMKAVIRAWMPKIQYYNAVLHSPDAIPISVIAKDYGLSPQALNTYLHQRGIQYPCHGTWLLYQHSANEGYMTSQSPLDDSQGPYWTPKGRAFIYDLLKEDGILPLSARSNVSGDIEGVCLL